MKTLKLQKVLGVLGQPYKLPVRDDDGDIVWKDDSIPLAQREPEMEPATTGSILRHIITAVPGAVQAAKDGFFSYNLMHQLASPHPDGKLELGDEEYAWLHRLLSKRLMPFSKEQKEAGELQKTYGKWLFGLSDYTIVVQLTDIDSTPVEPKE